MPRSASGWGWGWGRSGVWVAGLGLLLAGACQNPAEPLELGHSIGAYRDRMLVQSQANGGRASASDKLMATPVAWQANLPARNVLLVEPPATTQPTPAEVLAEMPDPTESPQVLEERLARLRAVPRADARVVSNYEKVVAEALDGVRTIGLPRQVRLSLAECVQRALEHNYSIRIESYNPAISQAQLVEAEAAFDVEFFLDSSYSQVDQPTASDIQASATDTRSIQGGFRKLLPTGMQVSTSLGQQRTDTDFQFQTLNPAWASTFTVTFTQPLLRNFGLEVNRAQINIRRAERDIAQEAFVRSVRDRLLEVETTYWRLMATRRTASILAEQVAQNKVTYLNMRERQEHDATEVELSNSEAHWRTRQVEFQESIKNIRDVEDQLKSQLNDPELLLSDDLEIIPTETPFVFSLALDQLAAVRTALDRRSEIREARLRIDESRINTASAKNQLLPQLDLSLQYEVNGLGNTSDNSFDNVTTNRFLSYTVQAKFSYPIGNRARDAQYRQAQLRESQAIASLHQVTDTIVQEVNGAVRTLTVRHAQIAPQLLAAQAADRNLRALQARTQRIDPSYLQTELSAVEQLFSTRVNLLGVIADYNVAIITLEKAKGTLLAYNNVVVRDEPTKR